MIAFSKTYFGFSGNTGLLNLSIVVLLEPMEMLGEGITLLLENIVNL